MKLTIVLLIAHNGFQAKEYSGTKAALSQLKSVHVLTASDKAGKATAHDASTVPVDLTIDKIDPTKIDGLFLIGGPDALTWLDTPQVHALLQKMKELHKPYGSICISSRILAKAGVLTGKKATGWDGDNKLAQIFKTHSVTYTREPVTTDGNIVTATGPSAADQFGKSIVTVLEKKTS
jgi:protease I